MGTRRERLISLVRAGHWGLLLLTPLTWLEIVTWNVHTAPLRYLTLILTIAIGAMVLALWLALRHPVERPGLVDGWDEWE